MVCEMCDDGDGNSAYPYYGVAPHTHNWPEVAQGKMMVTKLEPKETWPANFSEDPEAPGCGVYMWCPHCHVEEEVD